MDASAHGGRRGVITFATVAVLATSVVAGLWPSPAAPPRGRKRSERRRPRLDVIGGSLRSRLPRHRYLDLVSDRSLAGALSAVGVLLLVAPPGAALVPPIVVGWGMRRERREAAVRRSGFVRTLPEAIDLLALAVGSGLTPRLAIDAVAPWLPCPYAVPIAELRRRTASGEPLVESLERCRAEVGPEGQPLFSVLVAAERDGAPLLPALERAATEARRTRRVAAETTARTIPVAMLLPLVLCVLPAFALLTVVPLLLSGVAELELPG